MRIALLTYRGNMYCGGQGIYAAYLAREWKRAGHDVHVIAGPPLPEVPDGVPLVEIPNENVFGVRHPEWVHRPNPFALLDPVNLWELGVSRFGVFPEMQTFGLRLLARWKRLLERHRFDIVFDNQSSRSPGGCSRSGRPASPSSRSSTTRCTSIARPTSPSTRGS